MYARTLALAISLFVLPVCADAQTKASPETKAVVDSTLVARVRTQLAAQLGPKPAARVTVTAKDGVVRVIAPELALTQRDAVVRGVRAVPGVKDVIAVVGTVFRPSSTGIIGEKLKAPAHIAGVVGEKGKVPANTAGIIGEKGKAPAHIAGIVGEKGRVPANIAGIVGEKGKVRTNTAGIVGEKGKAPAHIAGIVGEKGRVPASTAGIIGEKVKVRTSTAGVIGEKSKVRTNIAGIVGEKGKVRDADAVLAETVRSRLVARLGGKVAGQLRVTARDGVVVVQPVTVVRLTALQVRNALAGLAGMRRLETW